MRKYEALEAAKRRAEEENAELRKRIEELQQKATAQQQATEENSSATLTEELRKANEMIAALKNNDKSLSRKRLRCAHKTKHTKTKLQHGRQKQKKLKMNNRREKRLPSTIMSLSPKMPRAKQ